MNPDINNNTQEQNDPWSNEHFYAERNYEQGNQQEKIVQYVKLKPKFPVFLVTALSVLLVIILCTDFYNTATHNNRTFINTVIDGFETLIKLFKS